MYILPYASVCQQYIRPTHKIYLQPTPVEEWMSSLHIRSDSPGGVKDIFTNGFVTIRNSGTCWVGSPAKSTIRFVILSDIYKYLEPAQMRTRYRYRYRYRYVKAEITGSILFRRDRMG